MAASTGACASRAPPTWPSTVDRPTLALPGHFTTAVGYARGITPNPTDEEVCSGRTGHAEVVLVVFDPAKVGYETASRTLVPNSTSPSSLTIYVRNGSVAMVPT